MISRDQMLSALESALRFEETSVIKIQNGCALRYAQPNESNATLELSELRGDLICRVTFRGTNRARPENYNSERAAQVRERFGSLAEQART